MLWWFKFSIQGWAWWSRRSIPCNILSTALTVFKILWSSSLVYGEVATADVIVSKPSGGMRIIWQNGNSKNSCLQWNARSCLLVHRQVTEIIQEYVDIRRHETFAWNQGVSGRLEETSQSPILGFKLLAYKRKTILARNGQRDFSRLTEMSFRLDARDLIPGQQLFGLVNVKEENNPRGCI